MGMCGAGHIHCYCLLPCSDCHTLSGTWGSYFLASGPSGLASGLGTFLAFWKDTLFQALWVHSCSSSGPQSQWPLGTKSGCGKWEIDTWVPSLSSVWPRVCPPSPGLHLHSPPLSSSPGHAGPSPYLPLLTWAWPCP